MDKELLKLLNDQINKELYSEYYYISMANYFMKKGLDGFANFFFQQAKEERIHAMKSIIDKLKLINNNVNGILMLNEQLSQKKTPTENTDNK